DGTLLVALDEHQHASGHFSTPSFSMTSTTAAAASGPSPRIDTSLGCASGSLSRMRPEPTGSRVGVTWSIVIFLAFILPGIEGYRGSTPTSITVSTAGSGTSK